MPESTQSLYTICRVYIKEQIFCSDPGPIPNRKGRKLPPNAGTVTPATCWCSLPCPELQLNKWQPTLSSFSPTPPPCPATPRPPALAPSSASHEQGAFLLPGKTTFVHPQPWPTSVASLPVLLLPWLPSSPLPATVHAVPRRLELGTTPSQGRGPPFPAMEPKLQSPPCCSRAETEVEEDPP